ncbi:MAG TPA: hypothetical protein VG820_00300 [Fimbriimonadaceae bacterium]|nr:hypothetical protein [Fimbriimonadaceae bacterium]
MIRASIGLLVASLAVAAPAQRYAVTDLGDVGQELMGAYAVNSAGQVVGAMSFDSNGDHFAFLWTRSGGMQLIVNVNSAANAINEQGQVAGEVNFGPTEDAFRWTAAGGAQDLGNLGGSAAGRSINAASHVVGGSFLSGFGEHPFVWTPANGMQDLGGPDGFATAIGCNDLDAVCGVTIGPSGSNAFVWTSAGGFRALTSLGGSYSSAYAINNAGQVAGDSDLAGGEQHGCFWTAAGTPVDMSVLAGNQTSWVQAMNSSGTSVGYCDDGQGNSTAFVCRWPGGCAT